MNVWRIFLNSLQLPMKKAMFFLNRTGMDLAIIYLCLLTAIASIPGFISRVQNGSDMNIVFHLIYFFIFYYLPLFVMIMGVLAAAAFLALGLAKWQQRKFRFQTLWKLSVYAATIPLLAGTVLACFLPLPPAVYLLFGGWILLLLERMILHYPKKREKNAA